MSPRHRPEGYDRWVANIDRPSRIADGLDPDQITDAAALDIAATTIIEHERERIEGAA